MTSSEKNSVVRIVHAFYLRLNSESAIYSLTSFVCTWSLEILINLMQPDIPIKITFACIFYITCHEICLYLYVNYLYAWNKFYLTVELCIFVIEGFVVIFFNLMINTIYIVGAFYHDLNEFDFGILNCVLVM